MTPIAGVLVAKLAEHETLFHSPLLPEGKRDERESEEVSNGTPGERSPKRRKCDAGVDRVRNERIGPAPDNTLAFADPYRRAPICAEDPTRPDRERNTHHDDDWCSDRDPR